MSSTFVMTVIGPDRPGLVQIVAAKVADHGGNWLESRMCHLGGQFAGILRIEVEARRRDEMEQALRELERDGLKMIIHAEDAAASGSASPRDHPGALAVVELVGQDQPGILRSISGVFSAYRVNVEELTSECVSAPMGGGMLFRARAVVLVPPTASLAVIMAELEKIGADLMVDVKLEPAPRPQ